MLPATLPRTVVVLALLLGLAACADAPSTPAAAPVDTRAVDIAYAQGMIPHHEQALELSALARGRAASPDLADLADLAFRIDRDQVEELGQLQGLLRAWGQDPAAGGGMAMTGMADPATLERLRTSSGRRSTGCGSKRWSPTTAAPSRWPAATSLRPARNRRCGSSHGRC